MNATSLRPGAMLSPRSIRIWRIVQALVWLVGATIVFNLFFFPETGILLFWNILIPVAPALVVVAVGLWRNVCPMASVALFPRHMGWSAKRKLPVSASGLLSLIAVVALFAIVPLRHALFNTNGMATAVLLSITAAVAMTMGFLFEWKSGWCSGLCPVHPVEKLYGSNAGSQLPNAHCDQCHRCVIPCPDTTPNIGPGSSTKTSYHRIAGMLMVFAFPGYVWGWFHVPDHTGITSLRALMDIYALPVIGALVSSVLFAALKQFVKNGTLTAIAGATAVSCYYWFRIPSLFGFGLYPTDGMLVDLSGSLPRWAISVAVVLTTAFFFWWIVLRKRVRLSWVRRPAYAADVCGEKDVRGILASE